MTSSKYCTDCNTNVTCDPVTGEPDCSVCNPSAYYLPEQDDLSDLPLDFDSRIGLWEELN